jgi:hypothetical protein
MTFLRVSKTTISNALPFKQSGEAFLFSKPCLTIGPFMTQWELNPSKSTTIATNILGTDRYCSPPGYLFGGVMRPRIVVLTLALCFIAAAFCFAASHDAQMGTWKLNEAKSKFGSPARNHTVIYEATGDNVKITVDGVDAQGKPAHNEWVGKFDGKEYPVTGDPNTDMRSYTVVDDHTLSLTIKKGGKTITTGKIVVSADGKSRTVSSSTTGPDGKKIENTAVFDKR